MLSLCVAKGCSNRHGVAFPTAIASAAWIEPAFSFFFARKLNAIGGFSGRRRRSFISLVRSCATKNGGETSPAAAASPPPSLKRFGPKFRFCPVCGGASEERVPTGEHEPRNVCSACGFVHYQNPKMVVGCLVEHEQKILLCRRSIQPSYGLWTLPAGYMELGESAAEGAVRETLEEAQAQVEPISMFAHLDIPAIGQCRAT